MDEKLHQRIFNDNLALIDTPLIVMGSGSGTVTTSGSGSASGSGYGLAMGMGIGLTGSFNYPGSMHGVPSYPFNISGFHQRHMAAAAVDNEPFDIIDTGLGYGGNGNAGVYYQSMCTRISMNVIHK